MVHKVISFLILEERRGANILWTMRNTIFVLFGIWQFCSFACCDFVFASLVRNIIGTFFFSGRSFRTNCEPICGQLSGKRQTMFFRHHRLSQHIHKMWVFVLIKFMSLTHLDPILSRTMSKHTMVVILQWACRTTNIVQTKQSPPRSITQASVAHAHKITKGNITYVLCASAQSLGIEGWPRNKQLEGLRRSFHLNQVKL